MEIFFKIIASMFSIGIIGVITALAIGAPSKKDEKYQKIEEIKQGIIFVVIVLAALYYIWS